MDQQEWLARQFEDHRPRLRGGRLSRARIAQRGRRPVQDTWLRLNRADTREVEGSNPEHEALLADAVGLALLVVLETLTPAERAAFVLHDMFSVPFEEIAPIVERSPEATRQLASRTRRRARGAAPVPDADLTAEWEVVEAFHAPPGTGDFDGLRRSPPGCRAQSRRRPDRPLAARPGCGDVARQALLWSREDLTMRRALVDGAAGAVTFLRRQPFAIAAVTIRDGKIVEIDHLTDTERIAQLVLAELGD